MRGLPDQSRPRGRGAVLVLQIGRQRLEVAFGLGRLRGALPELNLAPGDGGLDQIHLHGEVGLGDGALEDIAQRLVPVDAVQVVLLEPEVRPLRQHRLHLRVVEVGVEEGDVRELLERVDLGAVGDDLAEALEDLEGEAAVLEGGGAAALEEEDGIHQVRRQRPPLALLRAVQIELVADWEVELGLEGVQHHVDLVQQEHRTLKGFEHGLELGHLGTEFGGAVLGAVPLGVVEALQRLHVDELDGLEGRRGRHHHPAVLPGVGQAPVEGRGD
mmetsp:Transcript_68572/g.155104  ORF Transcript_68572/g.155104 Transcript_68572/m.155104 type:complete len:272 (+) Transcript_68572:1121-1936(+)